MTQHDRELGQQSVAWTLAHTDEAPRTSCAGCRSTCASSSASGSVHLVHGSPRKVNEYLFEDKPAQPVRAARAPPRPPTRSCSGTPTSRGSTTYGGVLFVNCGSVGKPKDGDPRAGFAILELDEAGQVRRRSSASPTTPRRSRARSRRRACPASTPRSWSPPHSRGRSRDEVRAVRMHPQRGALADGPGVVRAMRPR